MRKRRSEAPAAYGRPRSALVHGRFALALRPAGMVVAVPAILDPLRERDLALLFAGKAVSLAGDGIYVVALAWQVYALSNVPAALSLVGLALSLPQVALFLVGGVLSDRFERHWVMLVADAIRAAALLAMGALAVHGALELWHVVALGPSSARATRSSTQPSRRSCPSSPPTSGWRAPTRLTSSRA